MIPLYTVDQFHSSKSRGLLPLKCETCHQTFYGTKNEIQKYFSRKSKGIKIGTTFRFCGQQCKSNGKEYQCKHCGISVYRTPSTFKHGNTDVYCSKKCSAIYTQRNGGHCKWSDEDKERLRAQAKNNPKFVPGWNKGKKFARTISLHCRVCNKQFEQIMSRSNRTQTCGKDCRRKIQSINLLKQYENGKKVYGGTTKWLRYKDIKVQGSYEYRTCVILDAWKEAGRIKQWKYAADRFPYVGVDGKFHTYLIDFKVWNSSDIFYYLETKGFEKENDQLKWQSVRNAGHRLDVWFNSEITANEKELNFDGACSITG